jgi:hypothetical protein
MTDSSDTYYYMQDGLGSVRNLVDSSENVEKLLNGTLDYAVVQSLSAQPGTPLDWLQNVNWTQPGGLGTNYYDAATGICCTIARHMMDSPNTLMFISSV